PGRRRLRDPAGTRRLGGRRRAVEAVEFASARVFGATDDETGVRSLGTILMTDIVGSTATLERVGDARWHSLLLGHNERLRAQIERFGGREIRTTGDGFQVLFTGAARG